MFLCFKEIVAASVALGILANCCREVVVSWRCVRCCGGTTVVVRKECNKRCGGPPHDTRQRDGIVAVINCIPIRYCYGGRLERS